MTTIYTSLVIKGETIIFLVKRTHCQVNANLSLYYNLEHMAALSSPLLLVELRCNIKEGQTHFSPCKTMFYGQETKLGIHEEWVVCWRNIVPILTKQCFARVWISRLVNGSQDSSLLLKETLFNPSEQCLVGNYQPPPTRAFQKLPH